MNSYKTIENLVGRSERLFIKQNKEWFKVLTSFETKNKYTILDSSKNKIGYITENPQGFISLIQRFFLRSHRPLELQVLNLERVEILRLSRNFFWFFSNLQVHYNGKVYGSIYRRYSLFYKNYELKDKQKHTAFYIKSIFWKLWSFSVKTGQDQEVALITKKSHEQLIESFTDTYLIDFKSKLTLNEKILIFSSGISIDFDYFENNRGSSSLLNFLGSR